MEYHIKLTQPLGDLKSLEDAIREVDPAAQIDIDRLGENLRVAAHLEAAELVLVLGRIGYPVRPQQVVQLPSICCGGCGG